MLASDLLKVARLSALAFVAVAAAPGPSAAATFPDLYTVTVDIDPLAVDRRADSIERGMAVLLSRVTGRSEAAAYPELAPLLESASNLVTSYGQLDADRVRVGFNGGAVQAALTDLEWPVWGAERPLVVLWAVIDFGDGVTVLALDGDTGDYLFPTVTADAAEQSIPSADRALRDSLIEDIVRTADRRGLPLRLPNAELTPLLNAGAAPSTGPLAAGAGRGADDPVAPPPAPGQRLDQRAEQGVGQRGEPAFGQSAGQTSFDPEVLLGDAGAVLLEPTRAYAGDFALQARIRLDDFGLGMDWTLTGIDGSFRQARTSSVVEGVDWVTDQFAAQYTTAGGLRRTLIDIEGIRSLSGYGRVMRHLDSVSIIESVDVQSYTSELLRLAAVVRGDASVLDRILELGGVLEPVPVVSFGPSVGAARVYRLSGDTRPPSLEDEVAGDGALPLFDDGIDTRDLNPPNPGEAALPIETVPGQ